MSESKLLCKDCKHSFVPFSNWIYGSNQYKYNCRKSWTPDQQEFSPVIGYIKKKAEYKSCSQMRIGTINDGSRCGEDGNWWEPKTPAGLFDLIKHRSA